METRKGERIRTLMNVLQGQNAIHLREVAELFDVSEMTIRRDLADNPHGLSLIGGYVTRHFDAQRSDIGEYLISTENHRQTEQKRRIGKLAAQFVKTGDTIFVDCGSTTPFLIDFIPDALEFTAVCNSLNVFAKLQQKPHCSVILCGGVYHRKNMVFESVAETGILDTVRVSKAFISAAGVSDRCGVTCFNFHEVDAKKKVMQRAQNRFLLVDHSKFDEVRAAYFAELTDFHYVISDAQPNPRYESSLREHGIALVT
ncbi:DNA-binding transcriptional repressor DeoR [Burkholderia gladioli]|uniref:DNA-binding transcriptional repressor DeoR n=1 Tax=Burkholderia gladioli TaxID=28095 RepID=UPI00164158A4|nr:DNA-binding transcriptional repressor DeoR [Burkholderia gladioli]MDA0570394.1 DNA-binding transcriptional repressor DeoR [Burkholderia gladioli]MDA0598546.1 DNA-binding transcriptional repressor DeoR [Burkholderia gladioli]